MWRMVRGLVLAVGWVLLHLHLLQLPVLLPHLRVSSAWLSELPAVQLHGLLFLLEVLLIQFLPWRE